MHRTTRAGRVPASCEPHKNQRDGGISIVHCDGEVDVAVLRGLAVLPYGDFSVADPGRRQLQGQGPDQLQVSRQDGGDTLTQAESVRIVILVVSVKDGYRLVCGGIDDLAFIYAKDRVSECNLSLRNASLGIEGYGLSGTCHVPASDFLTE